MSERLPEEKRKQTGKTPARFSYGGGLWMDEMVDRMMEQDSSGYVGFHCTYKRTLCEILSLNVDHRNRVAVSHQLMLGTA